jgi:hypothetical protein
MIGSMGVSNGVQLLFVLASARRVDVLGAACWGSALIGGAAE